MPQSKAEDFKLGHYRLFGVVKHRNAKHCTSRTREKFENRPLAPTVRYLEEPESS
jgi:hypothetical protein